MKNDHRAWKLDSRWRVVLLSLCMIIGMLLLLSVSHLIPVLLDVLSVRLHKENTLVSPPLQAFPIQLPDQDEKETVYAEETLNYKAFFPIVMRDEQADETQSTMPKSQSMLDGIDFTVGAAPISLSLLPDASQMDFGGGVEVAFSPGLHCEFGDGQACVYEFESPEGSRVVFASIHSGVGGDADALRDLIEGTGFNQGLFNPEQVDARLDAMIGSKVRLKQGSAGTVDLQLIALVRIPPEQVATYQALPVERALRFAAEFARLDPAMLGQDLFIFETCGWRLPGEAQITDLPATSSAVYIGLAGVEGD